MSDILVRLKARLLADRQTISDLREAVAESQMVCATMLEALQNLENDARKSMPPSAWQLVQNAVVMAGGNPKTITTPAADLTRERRGYPCAAL